MEHKDIYEHLANIYLDASSKRKKKRIKIHPSHQRKIFWLIIPIIIFIFFLSINYHKRYQGKTNLILLTEAININFNFDPAKKEIYTLNLNNLNLNRFKTLEFSLKKKNYFDRINLRVELSNKFKEKSAIYLKDIPHYWKTFRIPLSDFKQINYWSSGLVLSFIIEEWNTQQKEGIIYIDNLALLR